MNNSSSEQFDVLSNALRVFPEQILKLNYFIQTANDPEEGISNIEIACVNVLNQMYGMMCSLKDNDHISSIYAHDSITTLLCMRHVLQHKAGRIKNNLRDAFKREVGDKFALINYNASDTSAAVMPFYINAFWLQEGIQSSNNAHRFAKINSYLNFDAIKSEIAGKSIDWANCYIGITPLITEAVRQICINYGQYFSPEGYDSDVYYSHFLEVKPIDPNDFALAN